MAQPHGFKAVRAAVVAALLEGTYQHEARRHVDVKFYFIDPVTIFISVHR